MQKPKWEKPAPPQALGIVQLLIKEVEIESSESCFLLLRCGAQWGRSAQLPSSKNHDFNWEVRTLVPLVLHTLESAIGVNASLCVLLHTLPALIGSQSTHRREGVLQKDFAAGALWYCTS